MVSRRLVATALILFAVLESAAACTVPEEPIPPGQRRMVIHAVLDVGRSAQSFSLAYSDNGDDGSVSRWVTGATVTLLTPDGVTLTAVEDPVPATVPYEYYGPLHLYRIDLAQHGVTLVPGGTYTLQVRATDGAEASGSTTIPLAAAVPPGATEIFRVSRDTLRLSWTDVEGAESYEVQVARVTTFGNDSFREVPYSVFSRKPVTLHGTSKDPVEDRKIFSAPSKATATVLAVDANYYHYYRRLADPYVGASPSRLVGAVGVFGSVVPLIVRQLDVR